MVIIVITLPTIFPVIILRIAIDFFLLIIIPRISVEKHSINKNQKNILTTQHCKIV
ncbi:hypothetical protein SAMN05421784_11024 [Xenorhabdus koppenhoeferi]|uniref:Uncharacterized protein n=1 Tax=Xenorhabdus koppenhoeferi TaxID=351659 RepID=A0A1I7GVF6_9GAMM|nr:hypothetical protein SAMN05421784_11024 [Xenorhabdus koppenhoeferi]